MDASSKNVVAALILGSGLVGHGLLTDKKADPFEPAPGVVVLSEALAVQAFQLVRNSGAQGDVVCKAGVISNLPPKAVYCTDNKSAGFPLDGALADDLADACDDMQPTGEIHIACSEKGECFASTRAVVMP